MPNHAIPACSLQRTYPTYPDRLATFLGPSNYPLWQHNLATARSLAALGHVYDRPGIEAIEEGSRCVACVEFVRRETAVRALEGPGGVRYEAGFDGARFHRARCEFLQIRVPLEPQAVLPGLYGGDVALGGRRRVREGWEERVGRERLGNRAAKPTEGSVQSGTGLFSLPTELRLQIYEYVLPRLEPLEPMEQLHRDSPCLVTQAGRTKPGRLDKTRTAILQTCRTIRNEALDLLFARRTFSLHSAKALYLFLRQIGQSGRDRIQGVDVRYVQREDALAFSLLATCPKLRSLTLRRQLQRLDGVRSSPLWRTDGLAALLEISGLETVTVLGYDAEKALVAESIRAWRRDTVDDAEIVLDEPVLVRELTRPRGTESGVRWVNGLPDL